MTWRSPDSAFGWDNSENAIDGDVGSRAQKYASADQWTPWLDMPLADRVCDAVRIWGVPSVNLYQFDVWRDGAWVTFFTGGIGHDGWSTREFSKGVGGHIRVAAKARRTVAATLYFAELQVRWLEDEDPEPEPEPEPEPPPDPASFCEFIRAVGVWFIDLSLDIRELWLIGDFLATPFEWAGDLFLQGAILCCALFASINAAIAAVETGITPAAILTIIEEHWPTIYNLITDPADWFLTFLEEHFTTIYNIYTAPDEWFITLVEEHFTTVYEFITSPDNWFLTFLEEHFTTIYDFATDPIAWFLSFLEENYPILYYLIVDPEGEIRYLIGQWFDFEPYQVGSWALIVKAIMERYFPILWELYLDPELWIEEHILSHFTDLPDWLLDPLGWLTQALEEHFPLLYYLVVDPAGEMLYLIGLAFDLDPYEAQSAEFIVKALFERWFPTLYRLWRTLWAWAGEHDLDLVEMLERGLAALWEALEEGLEGIWEFLRNPTEWLGERFIAWVEGMTPPDEVYEQQTGYFDWGEVIETALTESQDIEGIIAPYMEERWED